MNKSSYPTAVPPTGTMEKHRLFTDIGRKLQQAYVPRSNWQIPEEVEQQSAMLDQIAWHSNRWYSLFDFEKFNFLYFSSNLPILVGDRIRDGEPTLWEQRYLSILQDHKSIPDFLAVRKQLLTGSTTFPKPLPVSSVCGTIVNLKGQRMRMHYRCTPLVADAGGDVMLSFDYLEDITSLMTSTAGYWMHPDWIAGSHIGIPIDAN